MRLLDRREIGAAFAPAGCRSNRPRGRRRRPAGSAAGIRGRRRPGSAPPAPPGSTSCASILLTMISRSRSRWAAHFIMRTAIGSMPVVALITTAAVSTASSAGSDWPRKSGAPGVSMRCAWMPPWRKCTSELFSERWALRSSGSQSLTVEPRSTVAGRADGAGFPEQGLDQAGLAGRGRPHQGQGAQRGDFRRRRHGHASPQTAPDPVRGEWQEGGTRGPWSLLDGNASMVSQRSRPGQDSPRPPVVYGAPCRERRPKPASPCPTPRECSLAILARWHRTEDKERKAARDEYEVAYYTKESGRPLQRKLLQRRLNEVTRQRHPGGQPRRRGRAGERTRRCRGKTGPAERAAWS